MKTKSKNDGMPDKSRRGFIRKGSLLVVGATAVGLSQVAISCNTENKSTQEEPKKEEEEMVSPNEDLMREHGLLNRMLLIYDTALARVETSFFFRIKCFS